LLPDLVQLWVDEQERFWAAPPPQVVAAVPPAPAPKRQGAQRIELVGLRLPAPRPARVPRCDAAPGDGETAIVFIRSGVELPDGTLAAIGDRLNLPSDQARPLVLQGAADYVLKGDET